MRRSQQRTQRKGSQEGGRETWGSLGSRRLRQDHQKWLNGALPWLGWTEDQRKAAALQRKDHLGAPCWERERTSFPAVVTNSPTLGAILQKN